jgi:hypothetical protein
MAHEQEEQLVSDREASAVRGNSSISEALMQMPRITAHHESVANAARLVSVSPKQIQEVKVLNAAQGTDVHDTNRTTDAHRSTSVRRFIQSMAIVRLSHCPAAARDVMINRLSERLAHEYCKVDSTFALKDVEGKVIRGEDGHPIPDCKGVAELLRSSLVNEEKDLLYATVVSSDTHKPLSADPWERLRERFRKMDAIANGKLDLIYLGVVDKPIDKSK